MSSLDNLDIYDKLDPAGMLKCIREVPQQIRTAWKAAMMVELPADYRRINRVIILGMGGSGIGGDLLGSLAIFEAEVPIWVYRDYDLPSFVDAKTLVIASSYSGQTEETISAFEKALQTDSKKLVITTAGKLKSLAEKNGIPVFLIDYVSEPRAALGYNFILLLGIFQNLGLISDKSKEVTEMVKVLDELSATIDVTIPLAANPAKQLATKLAGRCVVIYGAGILSEVAHRWKTQLNENSKAWAFHEVFPELNHNAVVGYEFPKEMAEKVFVVMLHSKSIHPRNLRRYKLTADLLARAGVSYGIIEAKGEGPLSQMMGLVFFGDYVSYYLAILYQTDPSPVKAISYLKEQLARPEV